MKKKIVKHWRGRSHTYINAAQIIAILTLLVGFYSNYTDSTQNKANIQYNTKWIGDNLKDKTDKITELEIEVKILQEKVKELNNEPQG